MIHIFLKQSEMDYSNVSIKPIFQTLKPERIIIEFVIAIFFNN